MQYLIAVRNAGSQSFRNVAERVNGAMELAISGQPIMLKVDDFSRASEEEKESAMETSRIEYIRRIHGQPCCNSKNNSPIAPSEKLFINPQEVQIILQLKIKKVYHLKLHYMMKHLPC